MAQPALPASNTNIDILNDIRNLPGDVKWCDPDSYFKPNVNLIQMFKKSHKSDRIFNRVKQIIDPDIEIYQLGRDWFVNNKQVKYVHSADFTKYSAGAFEITIKENQFMIRQNDKIIWNEQFIVKKMPVIRNIINISREFGHYLVTRKYYMKDHEYILYKIVCDRNGRVYDLCVRKNMVKYLRYSCNSEFADIPNYNIFGIGMPRLSAGMETKFGCFKSLHPCDNVHKSHGICADYDEVDKNVLLSYWHHGEMMHKSHRVAITDITLDPSVGSDGICHVKKIYDYLPKE